MTTKERYRSGRQLHQNQKDGYCEVTITTGCREQAILSVLYNKDTLGAKGVFQFIESSRTMALGCVAQEPSYIIYPLISDEGFFYLFFLL